MRKFYKVIVQKLIQYLPLEFFHVLFVLSIAYLIDEVSYSFHYLIDFVVFIAMV